MKLIRKAIVSIVSLLLVAICFGATTYAWFEVNSSAYVEGFDFTVISGQGFLVSVDGVNYSNDLSGAQITRAICVAYGNGLYKIDPETEKLVYTSSGVEVPTSVMEDIINEEIALMPRTSSDGINLVDFHNATADRKSYMQFSVWFKATSDVVEDDLEYDIFLNGEEKVQVDGKVIPATSIKSVAPVTVKLEDSMTAMINSTVTNLVKGDEITIASSNAMRLSIVEEVIETEEPEEEIIPTEPTVPTTTEQGTESTTEGTTVLTNDTSTTEAPKATIYELTDELDLGSYATDYNGDDAELNRLYNAENNAMYTYYNNLEGTENGKKLPYSEKPETVRSLMGEDLPKITTVKSGSDAKLVTFRFWLEGWDADCFDGLANSIIVQLTFTSRKIEED